MSLGFYRLIRGRLLVQEQQSPDGDSMHFVANDNRHFEGLPRYSPPTDNLGISSYQLRFQAIDTPELHYGGASQPHGLRSRDGLLKWLGVNPKDWNWAVAPKGFTWEREAAILCDGFEGHGRPISFVLKEAAGDDGSDIRMSTTLLASTYNHHAVEAGLAYLGIYTGGVSFDIRSDLLSALLRARKARRGLWKLDRTAGFTLTSLEDLAAERGALIYPKIFRRCVDALRWAGGELEPGRDLDDFLTARPGENDRFIVATAQGGKLRSRLSEVLEQVNNRIKIDIDLNSVEFISK